MVPKWKMKIKGRREPMRIRSCPLRMQEFDNSWFTQPFSSKQRMTPLTMFYPCAKLQQSRNTKNEGHRKGHDILLDTYPSSIMLLFFQSFAYELESIECCHTSQPTNWSYQTESIHHFLNFPPPPQRKGRKKKSKKEAWLATRVSNTTCWLTLLNL